MNKKELIGIIYEKSMHSKHDIKAVIDIMVETITEKLKDGEEVSISGFGKFTPVEKPERAGKAFGKETVIPARTVIKFKAHKVLK